VPTTIIFKGKRYIEGWFEEFSVPRSWRIEVSANGWTTDEIGLRWLQKCFIPAVQRRGRRGKVLLVLDGHGSHLTPAFDKSCEDNNIIPLCMPPHSSHLLQPLDVGCFGPLKKAYGTLIEQRARLGCNTIDKLDFLKAYPEAHQKVFTKENIQSGFRATGIHPFSPAAVLDKLQLKLSTPTPPPSRGNASIPSSQLCTPQTVRQVYRKASSVKELLKDGSRSPSTPSKHALDQFIKGCEVAIYNAGLLAHENEDLRSYIADLMIKKSRSRRQMTPLEGLSFEDAEELVLLRNNEVQAERGGSSTSANPTSERPRRAPPTCGNCGVQGHRRTYCRASNVV
jgi:hypothetical protein